MFWKGRIPVTTAFFQHDLNTFLSVLYENIHCINPPAETYVACVDYPLKTGINLLLSLTDIFSMIIKKEGVEQIIENEQYMNVEQEIEKRVLKHLWIVTFLIYLAFQNSPLPHRMGLSSCVNRF